MNKRNTIQKEVVARIVLDACDHPSADTIYERAKMTLPTISLATVYRILKDLVAEGKIIEVVVPSNPSRFDKTIKAHAHFKCDICGDLFDIDCDELQTAINTGKHTTLRTNIMLEGICANCK